MENGVGVEGVELKMFDPGIAKTATTDSEGYYHMKFFYFGEQVESKIFPFKENYSFQPRPVNITHTFLVTLSDAFQNIDFEAKKMTPPLWEGDYFVLEPTDLRNLSEYTIVSGCLHIECATLAELDDLEGLTAIGGDLNILGNKGLTNLEGLKNLTSIGERLYLFDNDFLLNLDALSNLTSIGTRLYLMENDSLTNIDGLNNVAFIGGGIDIYYNDSLVQVDGLNSVTSIAWNVTFYQNESLVSIGGLNNVASIGWELSISENSSLTSISGFQNLNSIDRFMVVRSNPLLTSLGLKSLNFVGYDFKITSNAELSDCLVDDLRTQIEAGDGIGGDIITDGNKYCSLQE